MKRDESADVVRLAARRPTRDAAARLVASERAQWGAIVRLAGEQDAAARRVLSTDDESPDAA